jgi:hypothetical protein
MEEFVLLLNALEVFSSCGLANELSNLNRKGLNGH